MLAPGITGGTEVFLENPDHAGTAVPILILLLLLDRAPERWYVPAAVCLLLAWVQVADQLTLIAATAPVAAVAGARLLVLAARRRPRSEFRYDGLLLAAAVGSVVLASLAEAVIRALGGFRESPLEYGLLAPVSQIPANARMMGRTLLLLFGANDPDRGHGGTHQLLAISADIHLIGLALAAAGFAVAVILFFTARMDRVTQIVAAATAATLAAGIFGTVLPDLAHAHEVAILLPLGAVLAGRMLSLLPPLASVRWRPGRWLPGRAAAVALGGVARGRAGGAVLRGQPAPGADDQPGTRQLARRPPLHRRAGRLLAVELHHRRQRRQGPGRAHYPRGDRAVALGIAGRLVPAGRPAGELRRRGGRPDRDRRRHHRGGAAGRSGGRPTSTRSASTWSWCTTTTCSPGSAKPPSRSRRSRLPRRGSPRDGGHRRPPPAGGGLRLVGAESASRPCTRRAAR